MGTRCDSVSSLFCGDNAAEVAGLCLSAAQTVLLAVWFLTKGRFVGDWAEWLGMGALMSWFILLAARLGFNIFSKCANWVKKCIQKCQEILLGKKGEKIAG